MVFRFSRKALRSAFVHQLRYNLDDTRIQNECVFFWAFSYIVQKVCTALTGFYIQMKGILKYKTTRFQHLHNLLCYT